MAKPLVTWFSHSHEHSLQWLKLGLMRLAKSGEIRLVQIPNELASGRLPAPMVKKVHRRLVVLTVSDSNLSKVVVADGEDSIFQTSPLIEHCDHYFMCSYRGSFFRGEPFDLGYPWQTEQELTHYKTCWRELQLKLRSHLHKGRLFYPIGPDLTSVQPGGAWIDYKIRNLRHRSRSMISDTRDWNREHRLFEERYSYLTSLREIPIRYDIVLKDSLWGWPRHRESLHKFLQKLAGTYSIHSRLSYRTCFDYEYAGFDKPSEEDFPIETGTPDLENYERMLASSRLAVFATGFHWGCRNIMTLAQFLGMKILSDPLGFETVFDPDPLEMEWNADGRWLSIQPLLDRLQGDTEPAHRKSRQAYFDSVMQPETVAAYVIGGVLHGP
jgi:hypothetical protein